LPRPETTLTILGWSTDGKVFYEITVLPKMNLPKIEEANKVVYQGAKK
jgi:hypothetical protein